jgi:hypothetical protein
MLEFIVSLEVVTTALSDLLFTLAVMLPEGENRFRNLTFQIFSGLPTKKEVAVLASSPYLSLLLIVVQLLHLLPLEHHKIRD